MARDDRNTSHNSWMQRRDWSTTLPEPRLVDAAKRCLCHKARDLTFVLHHQAITVLVSRKSRGSMKESRSTGSSMLCPSTTTAEALRYRFRKRETQISRRLQRPVYWKGGDSRPRCDLCHGSLPAQVLSQCLHVQPSLCCGVAATLMWAQYLACVIRDFSFP